MTKRGRKLAAKREWIFLCISIMIIVSVTGFQYLIPGLGGNSVPDLTYHLLRIEGVKEALLQGNYPVRIYGDFFDGYGYGSPLFYPDIFLVFPGILRIIGFAPLAAWKIYALSITITASFTTYFSFKYICKSWEFALGGDFPSDAVTVLFGRFTWQSGYQRILVIYFYSDISSRNI